MKKLPCLRPTPTHHSNTTPPSPSHHQNLPPAPLYPVPSPFPPPRTTPLLNPSQARTDDQDTSQVAGISALTLRSVSQIHLMTNIVQDAIRYFLHCPIGSPVIE